MDSVQTIHSIISNNNSMRTLDLSCNGITEEGGRLLREGLSQNRTLQVDLPRVNHLHSAFSFAAN